MKATLVIEGKEFPIEINDPELQKLIAPPKKTGYEKVDCARTYFSTYQAGKVDAFTSTGSDFDNEVYEGANYYSDRIVAENNARADRLMRQLRRFAVEHREKDIDWERTAPKYFIRLGHNDNELFVDYEVLGHSFGMIAFDSRDAAVLAIKAYHDELIWYFTEYKDSL